MGAQWLSGRVLDSRLRGCGFQPHRHHCVVSLSKTHLSLLSIGSTQEDLSRHNLKIVDWDTKQTKQRITIRQTKCLETQMCPNSLIFISYLFIFEISDDFINIMEIWEKCVAYMWTLPDQYSSGVSLKLDLKLFMQHTTFSPKAGNLSDLNYRN